MLTQEEVQDMVYEIETVRALDLPRRVRQEDRQLTTSLEAAYPTREAQDN